MSVSELDADSTAHPMLGGSGRLRYPPTRGLVRSRLRVALVGLDGLAAVAGLVTAGERAPALLTVGLVTLVAVNRAQGLYHSFTSSMRVFTYAALIRSAVAVGAVTHVVRGAAGSEPTAMSSIEIFGWVLLLAVAGHYAFELWLRQCRAAGAFRRRTVVIGDDIEAAWIVRLLHENPALGYDVVGVIAPRPPEGVQAPWLGDLRATARAIRAVGASGAVVSPRGLSADAMHGLIRTLEALGTHVHVTSGVEGIDCRRLHAVDMAHQSFLYLEPPCLAWSQLAAKRAVDVVVSTVGLILAGPILLAAAIAIKLDDRGPVLFRQQRAGLGGSLFRLHKLRTMEVGAEARLAELVPRNERLGPLFKLSDDPRVTRVGRFLRGSSIDELPQLLDVLLGRMSLVGPRPALPDEVAQFDTELLDRLRVKPGVTGLWQVEARDDADFAAYRRLDLFYVENWSVLLDLLILLDTVPTVAGRALRAFRAQPRLQGLPSDLGPGEVPT